MTALAAASREAVNRAARDARLDLFPPSFLYCAMPVSRSLPSRSSVIFLWILSVALMVGCAGKTLQYKEDHDRIVRIDQAVEALRKAYVERDRSEVEALLLPSGNLDQLQREMYSDFDTFRDIQLEFAIERILIEGDNIDVFVHWQGQWKRTPEDAGTRQRGHGRLAWVGTQSILLQEAQGDLPFGMGTRASQSDDPGRGQSKP